MINRKYGQSMHMAHPTKPNSPHYTDQMEMFQREEFKPMTFDKHEVLKKAEKIYVPIKLN